jgi:hypothetical protein
LRRWGKKKGAWLTAHGQDRRWGKDRRWEGGKKTKKRISNIEQGIMNVEGRYSIIFILGNRLSAAIPHFIIRYFLFDIRYSKRKMLVKG